ncbi:phosphatase PAP2 family protein [archaeon]|nr:MAG: phosphatase PAP2 family protein [archaeon]
MISAWTRVANRFDGVINGLLRWDVEALYAVSENTRLRCVARLLVGATYLGDGYLWGVLALGLILFGEPVDRSYVLIGGGISIINIAIFRLFKLLFARPRPVFVTFGLRSRFMDRYSFPSGHATTSFGLALVISHCYPLVAVQVVVYLAAGTIALSRIYMKEHYPLDVICGALLGICTSASLLPVFERLLF